MICYLSLLNSPLEHVTKERLINGWIKVFFFKQIILILLKVRHVTIMLSQVGHSLVWYLYLIRFYI